MTTTDCEIDRFFATLHAQVCWILIEWPTLESGQWWAAGDMRAIMGA